jgi:hypothetical protein
VSSTSMLPTVSNLPVPRHYRVYKRLAKCLQPLISRSEILLLRYLELV